MADPNDGLITDPSQLAAPSGPVTDPSQLPDNPDPPGYQDMLANIAALPDPGTPPLARVSVERQGLPGGAKRTAGLFGPSHDERVQHEAEANAQYDKQAADNTAAYGKVGNSLTEQAGITQDFYRREADLYHRQQDFYQTQSELEQRAADHAHMESQRYITSYKEQLAGVRQLMQTTGDPMGNLTFGQAAGLGFAEFAQGFLAARGVKIDVVGQVDRWVDRKIAEHQQMIQNARGLADDQLHLYDIARQTSQDDYEARQRMRGFVIEGLKTSIVANASRFNSDIANSHAQEQVARLGIEANKTAAEIQERRRQMVFGNDSLNLQEAAHRGTLELEREKIAMERDKQAAAAKAKLKSIQWLSDDSQALRNQKTGAITSGGKRVAYIDPDAPTEIQSEAAKAASKAKTFYNDIRSGVATLKALRPENMTGINFLDKESPEYRRWDAQRGLLVAQVQQALTGAQASEKETERFMAPLKSDAFWQKGGNAKLADDFQQWGAQKYENALKGTVGIKGVSGEALKGAGVGEYDENISVDPDGKAVWNADVSAPARIPSNVESIAGMAASEKPRLEEKQSAFYKQQADNTPPTSISDYENKAMNRVGEPNWSVHLDDLARAALDPEWAKGKTDEDPSQIQDQAREAIKSIAHGHALGNGPAPSQERQDYAMKLLQAMDNPDDLLKALK